jgi:hypothetical protein
MIYRLRLLVPFPFAIPNAFKRVRNAKLDECYCPAARPGRSRPSQKDGSAEASPWPSSRREARRNVPPPPSRTPNRSARTGNSAEAEGTPPTCMRAKEAPRFSCRFACSNTRSAELFYARWAGASLPAARLLCQLLSDDFESPPHFAEQDRELRHPHRFLRVDDDVHCRAG